MKAFIHITIFFTLVFLAGRVEAQFLNGSGTLKNPFRIGNVDDLQLMKDSLSAHYVLLNDIDASATKDWNVGSGFVPIGNTGNEFKGSLNGNGFTIDNLFIDRTEENEIGLFGAIDKSGSVKDLDLTNASISGKDGVAILAGYNYGRVTNIKVSGEISGTNYVGGLIGYHSGGTIYYSSSNATVSGSAYLGGFLGFVSNSDVSTSDINSCFSVGSVTGEHYVGGFLGYAEGGFITINYSSGSVHAEGSYGGGFAGLLKNGTRNTVSYTSASVTGTANHVGGFAGGIEEASVHQVYATGEVSGNDNIGGLIGSVINNDAVTQSYWDIITSGQQSSAGNGIGRTTEEMKNIATFIGWNFESENQWGIHPEYNNGYPFRIYFESPSPNDPEAINLKIIGEAKLDSTLTLLYDYQDEDEDPEYFSKIQWYFSDDTLGTNKISINTDGSNKYTVELRLSNKYISAEITPRDVFKKGETKSVSLGKPVAPPFKAGNGSKEDPYQISTVIQLQGILYYPDSYYILTNDIDASDTKNWNRGNGFFALKNDSGVFSGSFDGKNHTIDGLYMNLPSGDYQGVFGEIAPSSIFAENTISNVHFTNLFVKGEHYVGGIAGWNSIGTVRNVSVEGTVIGTTYVGGLIGYNNKDLVNCSSSGTILGNNLGEKFIAGGLAGQNSGTISNCNSTMSIREEADFIGGLVALNTSEINKSFYNDTLDGVWFIGGLVAQNSGSIKNSYSKGVITGVQRTGGMIGVNWSSGEVFNSYSGMIVNGIVEKYGGAIGHNEATNQDHLQGLYWDTEISGQTEGVGEGVKTGVHGKNTQEMMMQSTYIGWDFESTWTIEEGLGYPKLKPGIPVSNDIETDTPKEIELSQNYPNPFNPSTTIKYNVSKTGQVTLEVFNILGQKVTSLVNKTQNTGNYTVNFDASGLSSGMYFYRLQTAGKVLTKKMMLVK